MHHDNDMLMNACLEYMRRHHGQSQQRGHDQLMLVESCAAHLKDRSDIADATALRLAAHALGEHERRLHDCYIDMHASTSSTIFIRSRTGASYAFTSARLVELMRCHAIPIS